MFETLEDIWEFLCVHFCILGILQFRLPGKIRIEAVLTVREKKKVEVLKQHLSQNQSVVCIFKDPPLSGRHSPNKTGKLPSVVGITP